MKNIRDILAGLGIPVPGDKLEALDKEVLANYRTIADYEKQTARLTAAQDSLKTAQDGLKAFEGVDVQQLQGEVGKLQQSLRDKDAAHAKELAERDFTALVDGRIAARKGRSARAIRAMLDLDELQASKNQTDDLDAALDKLAKDSGWLFEPQTPPPYAGGTGTNPPAAAADGGLRAAFGLN